MDRFQILKGCLPEAVPVKVPDFYHPDPMESLRMRIVAEQWSQAIDRVDRAYIGTGNESIANRANFIMGNFSIP